jgi:PAS domain S-box-containing protein
VNHVPPSAGGGGLVFTTEDGAQLLDEVERVAGLGSYVWYVDSRRAHWSRGLLRLLGIGPDEPFDVHTFFGCVHPDDRPRVVAAFKQALVEGSVPPITYRIVRRDGVLRWQRAQGAPLPERDGQRCMIGTMQDVTDTVTTQHALGRVAELLAETQRCAGVGSFVYDVATGALEWSDELYEILGVDRGTPLTQAYATSLVHPDDLARQRDWVARVLEGEATPPVLVRMLRPDGRQIWLESRARRRQGDDGTVRVFGVGLDVTGRVELEQRLHDAAKMEAIGTLAAGVAHDFNNYLAVLRMQLDLLRSGRAEATPEALAPASQAVDLCAQLTRQLLAFARRQPFRPERIDLRDLVRRTLRLFQRLVDPSIDVVVSTPDEAVEILADSGQLEAAVMNLAVNARDAMPGGGRLEVTVDVQPLTAEDGVLDVGCAPGRYARLRVSDSGTGIAPEHLSRIFEPYFTTKPAGRGTGLGLASVYGTAKQHAGFVRVESALGKGSTFALFVPLSERSAAERRRSSSGSHVASLGGVRVLVVDDLDAVRAAMRAALESAGATVLEARDGIEALEQLRAHAVDVVVSDVLMPRMGGIELVSRLRAEGSDHRVILVTGYAGEEIAAGVADEILFKPFGRSRLVEIVARHAVLRRT